MTSPPDKAMQAAQSAWGGGASGGYSMAQAVRAAYPIIRADVIAEVAALLRAEAMDLRDNYWDGVRYAADFIEREFGA